jgi:predicted alpha/beta hydrolase
MNAPIRIEQHPFSLVTDDGFTLRGEGFAPAGPARGSVVIASALAVPRRVYAGFAHACAEAGLQAYTFDYRGIGDSAAQNVPARRLRMHDWGRYDIDAVLAHASASVPGPRYLVGHSCGGQLPGLAAGSERLDKAVFVAASAPRAGAYPFPDRLFLALLWRLAIPLLSIGRDYVPAVLSGSSAQFPAGVSRDWATWALSPDYLFDARHGLDTTRYARLALPILSLGFKDDRYAPPAAVEALLRHYPAAAIERRWIGREDAGGGIGHFGFFRSTMRETLWRPTLDWLLGNP